MVISGGLTLCSIYDSRKLCLYIFGQLGNDVDYQAILLLGSDNVNLFVGALDITRITNLTTRITIERSLVKHQLICCLAL